MKKLYTFIQTLMTKLSKANKEIIRLNKQIEELEEELYGPRPYEEEFDDTEARFWENEFRDQKFYNDQLVLFMRNVLHDQLAAAEEEKWQEEMECKYVDLTEDDQQCLYDWAMSEEIKEIQLKEDRDYLRWVEEELGIEPIPDYSSPCESCYHCDCFNCIL